MASYSPVDDPMGAWIGNGGVWEQPLQSSRRRTQYFDQQDVFGRWLEVDKLFWTSCFLHAQVNSIRIIRLGASPMARQPSSSSEFAEARDATPGLIMKTRNGTRWIVGVGLRASHDAPWPD